MSSNQLMEVGQDVSIRLLLDSFKAKSFKLDVDNLITQAIQSGVYFFFVKNQIRMRFNPNDNVALKFVTEVVARSSIDAGAKFIRKRQIDFKAMMLENAVFSGFSIVGGNVISQLRTGRPINGFSTESRPHQSDASQPIPKHPNTGGYSGFPNFPGGFF